MTTDYSYSYATTELESQAREEAAASQQRREEAQAQRAADHEEDLKRAYLSSPGTTPQMWEREKTSILAKDRERQTLERGEAVRRASAAQYRHF